MLNYYEARLVQFVSYRQTPLSFERNTNSYIENKLFLFKISIYMRLGNF